MFRAVGTGISTTSLDPSDPGFKKAAITKPDPVGARAPAQRAEAVAERPGDVNLGRDLLNIASEAVWRRRWRRWRQGHADDGRQDQDPVAFRIIRPQRRCIGSGVDNG